ncbi:ABC transporter ATP-binding protein [Sporosarcina koreensis]|uniref:ABC transporter ATP-binding protein n=1 Tax=Bacillales TaxID=1385 RepID=UPI00075226E2|nr:oligopeptide/dipeptide ABC transporter ATP-binding protein [Sporosarcina koreensis]
MSIKHEKEPEILLEVRDLQKHFKKGGNAIKAVDGISFQVKRGETLGIVGESGCGKSTMGRVILQLLKPTEGEVWFEGNDISKFSNTQLRKLRKDIQIIFQDPFGSLNQRMTVGAMLREIVRFHSIVPKAEELRFIQDLLRKVGLNANHYWSYPHKFSGGQRQRISIARALAVEPKLIICDEAVSALDVSVQAQILNLLKKLKREFGLTYIFISHDLSVVKHISDRVGVMYLGKMVELAGKKEIYNNPLHPYTKALFSAIPDISGKEKATIQVLKGDIPSPLNIPSGCHFHTRCPNAIAECKVNVPKFRDMSDNHYVSCDVVRNDNLVLEGSR